jgi:hypothetical protein
MDVRLCLVRDCSHDHGWSGSAYRYIVLLEPRNCSHDALLPVYVCCDNRTVVLHDPSRDACHQTPRQDRSPGSHSQYRNHVGATRCLQFCTILTNVSFVVAFTLPYLQDTPGANLGSKVGFIYGSICFVALVWGYFFLPELKGRSLEELDEIFAAKLPLRKFRDYQSNEDGVGAAVSRLERLEGDDPAMAKIHIQNAKD